MKVFRNLYLRGSNDQIIAMIEAVAGSLTNGWTRSHGAEARVRSSGQVWYCFVSPKKVGRPACELFITDKESDIWYVPNIVPVPTYQLSFDEYNSIIEEFCTEFVIPNARQFGVTFDLTEPLRQPEDWISCDAAQKLRNFSATANRLVGAGLSKDREKWLDFVLTVYRDGRQLDPEDLKRYLVEDEGWAEEVADRLASEFDFGTKMLTFAESNLQPT